MAEHTGSRGHGSHDHGGHGDPDPEILVGPVAKVLVAVTVVSLVAAALMWPMVSGFVGWSEGRSAEHPTMDATRPAGPLLQQDPEGDLDRYQQIQAIGGSSYGWIDEPSGIARIPLARAAELVLEQGLDLGPSAPAPGPSEDAGGGGEEGQEQ